MRRSRRSWVIYGACAALALCGLGWITAVVLRLERAELAARCDAGHQAALRLGLWRMDSWFGPHLARETARAFHEYYSYVPQERAYTRILRQLEPGEVLSPSPLLTFRSELVRLHFQIDAAGTLSSPQVPSGNLLDLAQATLVDAAEIDAKRAVLAQLAARLDLGSVQADVCSAEAQLFAAIGEEASAPPRMLAAPTKTLAAPGASAEWKERSKFSQVIQTANFAAPLGEGGPGASVWTGPFVPLWLPAKDGEPELCFLRSVRGGGEQLVQGFLTDWPRLCAELLAQVADLFPAARLEPRPDPDEAEQRAGLLLATIPAALASTEPAPVELSGATPARVTLLLSWIAALVALAAVGVTLHKSIAFGEKRSRFASAVTHELRTPLTTFRMYSEMLAKGMVPEAQRREYLATLERESERLAVLVENVLAYSRLEEGRTQLRRERVSLGELLQRALPGLARRAAEAEMALQVDAGGAEAVELETDPEAVEQILFNLVDNACKYGRSPAAAAIQVSAAREDGAVRLRVRDGGPGVPVRLARAIFHPFDRGGRDSSDPHPGVGLGLALARGLARDLGGDLVLEPAAGAGACFCLTLARARRAPA